MKVGVVAGIAALAAACAMIVVLADPFGSSDSPGVAAIVSPTETSSPSVTFYPTPTVPLTPVVINGLTIAVPPGADVHIAIGEPGAGYIYMRGNSFVGFTAEGWIGNMLMQPGDELYFDPTFDALFQAADSVVLRDTSLRIPRGFIYYEPFMLEPDPDYAGPSDEAPWLNIVKNGESYVSWDHADNLVENHVQPQDVEDFQPLLDALASRAAP